VSCLTIASGWSGHPDH